MDRRVVVQEILSTEEKYCADLRLLIDNFLKPLTKMAKENKPLLTQEEITIIFHSVATIYGVDSKLLAELKKEGEHGQIGRVFVRFGPFLKIYAGYLSKVKVSLHTLHKIEQEPIRGDRFLAFFSQQTDAASLESLLIKV